MNAIAHSERVGSLAEPDGWQHCGALREPLERRLTEVLAGLSPTSVFAAGTGAPAPLGEPLSRIVSAGGKRLRAALTLTVARVLAPDSGSPWEPGAQPDAAAGPAGWQSRALELAAAAELLHAATLVHDDLIDDAPLRRGVPTIHAREGGPAAVIGGDLLIAAASMLASGVSQRAGQVLAETLLQLCRGEALEGSLRFNPAAGPEELLEVVTLKTGSLMRAACLLGAEAAGAGPSASESLGRFGMEFGIVLQLVDDLLDIVSTPELAGKPVGVNFPAGVPTLPAAFAMQLRPELRGMFSAAPTDRARAIALLRSPDAVRAVIDVASGHAERAAEALAPLPAAGRLAEWPGNYLRQQLSSRSDPELGYLLRPAVLAS